MNLTWYYISNPIGIENDFNKMRDGINVIEYVRSH